MQSVNRGIFENRMATKVMYNFSLELKEFETRSVGFSDSYPG